MKQKLMLLLLLPLWAAAQPARYVDLALGVGSKVGIGALSAFQLHPIGKAGKLQLGYGIRLNALSTRKPDYVTAPAVINSKQAGPLNIFSADVPENFDTLRLADGTSFSLNAALYARYQFNDKWSVGFNIDVIGVSFGSQLAGVHSPHNSTGGGPTATQASPTSFNLLLTSNNDLGSLNSELYAGYQLNEQLGLRAGFGFYFVEYTTTDKFRFGNDRFRHKAGVGFLAINYRLNP